MTKIPTTNSPVRHEALECAARDWPVFPVHTVSDGECTCRKPDCSSPGKHPRIPHGFKEATTNSVQIEHWSEKWSDCGGCNFGVATGRASGFFVLDEDPRHGGDKTLLDLERRHGPLPATPMVKTGGGGTHIYFACGERTIRSRNGIAPGLDVKAEGGYVVLPGSRHAEGDDYEWVDGLSPNDVPLAEPPAWLVGLITSRPESPNGNGRTAAPNQIIAEGERNTTLASLAGAMRRRGMGQEAIQAALLAENSEKCVPPLADGEVEAIARSVARYKPAANGSSAPSAIVVLAEGAGVPEEAHHASDLGNAERFAAQHRDCLRYCHPWQSWLTWDARRWIRDRSGEAVRRAKETARAIYGEAAVLDDQTKRATLAKHALATEAQRRILAMLDLAKSDKRMVVLPEEFDGAETRFLLNVSNGTLDLRTGALGDADPSDYITKLAAVKFDEEAECTSWNGFLERVVPEREARAFLQRFAGYCLTGDTSEQAFCLLYGTGANGKSTFLEALLALMGDYALKADFETFLEAKGAKDRKGAPRVDLLELAGRRLVVAIETSEGRRLDASMIKELTGGDTLTARGLYHTEQTSFRPQAKLFLAANHRPEIREATEAIWRRVHEVPFMVTIPAGERDPGLAEKLRQPGEQSGILNWALAGCLEWQRTETPPRLRPPDTVIGATQAYREDQDALAPFLAARCVPDPRRRTTHKALRAAYTAWCEESEEEPIGDRAFGRALEEHGFQRERGKDRSRTRSWVGVRLPDMFDAECADTSDASAEFDP